MTDKDRFLLVFKINLIVFIIVYFFLYFRKINLKRGIYKTVFTVIGFTAVILPWLLRADFESANATVTPRGGELLITRAELMENTYPHYGSHLIGHLFGYYFAQFFDPAVSASAFREAAASEEKIYSLLARGVSHAELDRILTAEGRQRILNQPFKYLLFSFLDFISFNSPIIPESPYWQNSVAIHPMFADGRHPEIPPYQKVLFVLSLRVVWFVLIFWVIYGFVKKRQQWPKFCVLLVFIIYFNLIYSLIHAIPRYALPIYPFYFILATVGISAQPMIYSKFRNILIFLLCLWRYLQSGKANKIPSQPSRILIVQLAGVGDMVCTTPMFRAIKLKYPEARLIVLGSGSNKDLLENNSDVDQYIIHQDSFWKQLDQFKKLDINFAAITAPRFSVLAQLYLAGVTAIVTPYITNGHSPYETKLYRLIRKVAVQKEHKMEHYAGREYLKLLEPLNIKTEDTAKHLAFSRTSESKVLDFFNNSGIYPAGDFIVGISPSSGNKIKNWSAKKFARLADHLIEKYHAKIIVIGVADDSQEVQDLIKSALFGTKIFDTLSLFNLEELKALISKMNLFVSVDTGPIYIAEAFHVPTVDIIGPIDEREQPPIGEFHKIVVAQRKKPELYVMNARRYNRREAIRQSEAISTEMVIEKVDELIQKAN